MRASGADSNYFFHHHDNHDHHHHHYHFCFTSVSMLAWVGWGFSDGLSLGQPILCQS